MNLVQLETAKEEGKTIFIKDKFSKYNHQSIDFANQTFNDNKITDIEVIDDLELLAFYDKQAETRRLFRFEELSEQR